MSASADTTTIFDEIRSDFPQLKRSIRGTPLVYLDSAATSLKPQSVIDAITGYYTNYCANIFRGIYTLSEEATAAYEGARKAVATFIGASDEREVIVTRNTSESINLVAHSWGRGAVSAGDGIVISIMEHHSNFVPWQELARQAGATVSYWGAQADGTLNLSELETLVTDKTKIVAITAVSNVLGTITPVPEIVSAVKRINPSCMVLVDAAQAVPHMRVDMGEWGADFVAFSSHKMLGPTGIGILWGKRQLLEEMPPYQYGGEMIDTVQTSGTTFAPIPHKFEAGTPHIAGMIGLGAAVEYLERIGMDAVRDHEKLITRYTLDALDRLGGVRIYGPVSEASRGGVVAFSLEGVHPHDIAQVLSDNAVCIRSGHHCAMPLHQEMQVIASARASFYIYTTKEDIDSLINGLEIVKEKFRA